MRVLWLCNIMLPMIAEQLNREASNKEGWLTGIANRVLSKEESGVELAVAFPVPEPLQGSEQHIYDGNVISCGSLPDRKLRWYGFIEDVRNPHVYEEGLELSFHWILKDFQPDVVHCFGTEYPHTLALCKAFPYKNRILIGIQGLCAVYAEHYYANLPESVIRSKTPRDLLKRDDCERQKYKFELRGEMEKEAIRLAGNITGRTHWDRHYTSLWNPGAEYFAMNETLRSNFYDGEWREEGCRPHSIFISQGDYPIKGLHYMLLALPGIRKKYPDVKVYVAGDCIIGEGDVKKRLKISGYGRFLRNLIRHYQLEDHLCFLGRLNAEQMKQQYLQSSLFVCCSEMENSPNSLGEAMLLGMPCVSADVGGIRSVFTGGEDGICYPVKDDLHYNAEQLKKAVLAMWSDSGKRAEYCAKARAHANKTHDGDVNYQRLLEIYCAIAEKEAQNTCEKDETGTPLFVMVSNYINHHQIPFCNAMRQYLSGRFVFIQTEPMEQERVQMGWAGDVRPDYVKCYYEEPEVCQELIANAPVVLFGGVDEEAYIAGRLESGKPVLRYSERLYKDGQWKAVSPRGLRKKYADHTKYRNAPVYLLCAGAYVPSDFHIVRAYPDKMYKWGYFPEVKPVDVDSLMAAKKPATILWAARFLDWKHPESAVKCAAYLKKKGITFTMRIVGDGNERPMVERLIAKYGLSGEVSLLGYRTPNEVRALMEETDIYLATSDRREGWGAVINEAMNSGCAVVADHMMGAAPYLLQDGRNGYLYEDGNLDMLCKKVEILLNNRQECQKLGRNAIDTVKKEWNAECAAKRLLMLCKSKGLLLADTGVEEIDCMLKRPLQIQEGPCSVAEVISEREMLCRIL